MADPLRVAAWNASLSRKGPGLLLRDIRSGDDAQIESVMLIMSRAAPDVILLMDVDYDHDLVALNALRDRLANFGLDYPYVFARRPNSGLPSGHDLDGNGRLGQARDAQGYGRFNGDGGMAILSRFPLLDQGVQDFSTLKWTGQAWATPPPTAKIITARAAADAQRLSSVGHWVVPVQVGGTVISLLAWHATPPVFDGPEDRNGLRNRDEARLWLQYLDGKLGTAPDGPVIVIGGANADPSDGEARREALNALLNHPRLQDPQPRGRGDLYANAGHLGDPALDTVDWDDPAPGNLRVDYILPSKDLHLDNAGVFWPAPDDPMAKTAALASRHRLVWVDLDVDQAGTAPSTAIASPSR